MRVSSLVRIDLPHMHAIIYPIIIETMYLIHMLHGVFTYSCHAHASCMLLRVQTLYLTYSDQNIGGSE